MIFSCNSCSDSLRASTRSWRTTDRSALATLVVALVLLGVCKIAAADCGVTLQAIDFGNLSNNLSRVAHVLLDEGHDHGAGVSSGREGSVTGIASDARYGVAIATMRLQSAVDRLAVLTQLRDLMRQSEDRQIIQGAITSFAARAAELSESTAAQLAAPSASLAVTDPHGAIRRVRELAHAAAHLLASCKLQGPRK